MASSSIYLFLSAVLLALLLNSRPATADGGRYAAIFSFGDSLTDTGNYLNSGEQPDLIKNFPYGETYFHRPTGRYSDGRIILDFIAQAQGLPLVRPYLAGGSGDDFRRGANFAVGGATALDISFFVAQGFDISWTEYSLSCQLDWFKKTMSLLTDWSDILSKSLVILGEIGGNDYIYSLVQQKTIDEVQSCVPEVIKTISSAANELISLGARTVLIPGLTPFGCVPLLLTVYQTDGIEGYVDLETGCINWLNEFAEYHNNQLKKEVEKLQNLHPQATIIYGDYYGNAMQIYRSPQDFGFKTSLAACCGATGPYNVNLLFNCGDGLASVCSNPSDHISWDGVHYTEATYKIMANALLEVLPAAPTDYRSSS